jgi:hypothetical protein
MNASMSGNQSVQPLVGRVEPEAPHDFGRPIGPLSVVSPGLAFLLAAYVGADWRLERQRNSSRWRAGAEALYAVLRVLEVRDSRGVETAARCGRCPRCVRRSGTLHVIRRRSAPSGAAARHAPRGGTR